jgi:hypothetical protein
MYHPGNAQQANVWLQCWDLQGPRGLEQRYLRKLNLGDLKKGPNGGVSPTPQQKPCRILHSHSGGYEELSLLDSLVVRWYVTEDFCLQGYNTLLAAWFMLVSCLSYYSTLNMKAIYSSEMSVDFQQITWRYIPEDRTLQINLVHSVKYNFFVIHFNIILASNYVL